MKIRKTVRSFLRNLSKKRRIKKLKEFKNSEERKRAFDNRKDALKKIRYYENIIKI